MSPFATLIVAGACGIGMITCFVIALCQAAAEGNRERYELADAILDERAAARRSLTPPTERNEFRAQCWDARREQVR